MEKQKAIALKEFVLEAEETFQTILEKKKTFSKSELNEYKKRYKELEFDSIYDEFEEELRSNLKKYSNYSYIEAYLKNVFQDACRSTDIENTYVQQIIEEDYETAFLLKLLELIFIQFDNFNFFSGNDKHRYRALSSYFDELLEEDEDETSPTLSPSLRLKPENKSLMQTMLAEMIQKDLFHTDKAKGNEATNLIISAFEGFMGEDFSQVKTLLANKNRQVEPPKANKNKTATPTTKPFENYLLHAQNMQLASALSQNFMTEKGKAIRILIEVLQTSQPPLLTIARGEGVAFYEAMKLFFGRDIGTYNSIFNYTVSNNDSDVMQSLQTRLNFILEQLK